MDAKTNTSQTQNMYFITSWKTSAVSTTVWMVETQLCKLRGTSDTFVYCGFCELNLRYDYYYSVLHKISSARVLCFVLMKEIGRWLPRMLPGSTGRFSITIILKNVSCEYDRWVVETQLCKLRDMSDTLIGLACVMLHLYLSAYRYFGHCCTSAVPLVPVLC